MNAIVLYRIEWAMPLLFRFQLLAKKVLSTSCWCCASLLLATHCARLSGNLPTPVGSFPNHCFAVQRQTCKLRASRSLVSPASSVGRNKISEDVRCTMRRPISPTAKSSLPTNPPVCTSHLGDNYCYLPRWQISTRNSAITLFAVSRSQWSPLLLS